MAPLVPRSWQLAVESEMKLCPRAGRTDGFVVAKLRIRRWLTGPGQFMRRIRFSFVMRSVEFRSELRLEAAAGFFELRFSPRRVSQQRVQPLGTQYQQSEHKYEQDFGAHTHDSPLDNPLVLGSGGRCAGRLLFVSFHG
jgi:hypothetical protein